MLAYHIDLELVISHRPVHAYSSFTGLVEAAAQEITLALEGRSR